MSVLKNWMGTITRRPFFGSNIGREVRLGCRNISPLLTFFLADALKSLLIIERTPSPDPEIISISASPARIVKPELVKKEGVRALPGIVRGRASPMRTGTDEQQNSNGGPSVKREHENGGVGSSRKKRKSHASITIDLTEDSDDDNIICLN